MSLIYRGIYVSQSGDHILSIMLAMSTIQLQSEIWYTYANVFFQNNSSSPESDASSSEGLCDQVFIFVFSSQLSTPLVSPSRYLYFIVMTYMSKEL